LNVSNFEYATMPLMKPPVELSIPDSGPNSSIWYGRIMRRLPGDGYSSTQHYVRFVVEYAEGVPTRAWCDENFNGSLLDESTKHLNTYPSPGGSRSILTHLRWDTVIDGAPIPIDWIVRVIFEPATGPNSPVYRTQMVYSPEGVMKVEGRQHRAFLFDGNGDGVYSQEFLDGIYVDLDDDLHFNVDPMSNEFCPLSVPFQIGDRLYRAKPVDAQGRQVSIQTLERVPLRDSVVVGGPAPRFEHRDLHCSRIIMGVLWSSISGRPGVVFVEAKRTPSSGFTTGIRKQVSRSWASPTTQTARQWICFGRSITSPGRRLSPDTCLERIRSDDCTGQTVPVPRI
jgi:hypothetical protein